MTLFFSWIIWFVGEVGAMAFGRLMSTVYTLIAVGTSLEMNLVVRVCLLL